MAVFLTAGGCSTEREAGDLFGPSEAGTIVVDATLTVGRGLPGIFLTITTNPDRPFTLPGSAADAQEVWIGWNDGSSGGRVTYEKDALHPGRYFPMGTVRVLPETTYQFFARMADGRVVQASTTTPPEYRVTEWVVTEEDGETIRQRMRTFEEVGEDIYEQPENQVFWSSGLFESRFERPDVAAFQVGIFSLDEDSDFVIDPGFFDEEDFASLQRFESSPPFEALDGRLRLPWFAVYFEGRYKIKSYAVDRNWYDLIRSSQEFGGGGGGFGGNAGDGFERPIFNIDGGIGLFGSASVDSIGFYVHPRP